MVRSLSIDPKSDTPELPNSSGYFGGSGPLEFINHIPAIVWEVPTDARLAAQGFTYLSAQAETILGYPLNQLRQPAFWSTILHEGDVTNYRKELEEIRVRGGDGGIMHYRIYTASGKVLRVEAKIVIVRNDEGVAIAMRGVTTDVSERYRNELRWKFMARASELLGESENVQETLGAIGELLVSEISDVCMIHLLEDDGSLVKVIQSAKMNEVEELLISISEQFPSAQSLWRDGEKEGSILMENIDDELLRASSQSEEHFALLKQAGMRSSITAPLVIQGEILGTLTLATVGLETSFTVDDQVFVEELARQTAQAMYKARLRQETQIETELRLLVQERMEFLATASAVLASTLDAESSLAELAKLLVPQFADLCLIMLSGEGDTLRPVALEADPKSLIDVLREMATAFPVDPDGPKGIRHVMRSRVPDIHLNIDDSELDRISRSPEHRTMISSLGLSSVVTYPLEAHGSVYGAIVMGFTKASGRRFAEGGLAFIEEITRRSALALYKSRLLEDANDELDRRQILQERMEVLEAISRAVATSKDVPSLVDAVCTRLAPRFCDWLIIDLINEAGDLQRLRVYHSEPSLRRIAKSFFEATTSEPEPVIHEILKTGKSIVLKNLEEIRSLNVPDEKRKLTSELGSHSALLVPLHSRDETRGVLSLIFGHSRRSYSDADTDFAMEIASRLAIGLDSAMLFSETRRQMAELQSIYHTSPIGLALIGRDFRYIRINKTLADLNGITWQNHIGKSIVDVLPELGSQTRTVLESVFETGVPIRDLEMRRVQPQEPLKEYVTTNSFYPVQAADGSIAAVSLSVVDITERKIFERKLQEAKEAAEVASGAKDQFIAALSHELRTPLTPVLATVDLLETDPELPAHFQTFLDLIRRNVEIEARLIDDLLDLTRIAKGKLTMHIGEVNLHVLLPRVIEVCAKGLERKQIRLITEFNAQNPFVMGDSDRLQQVFWNLLHNAVKYTPESGTITLRTFTPLAQESSGAFQSIIIEVEDTGRGIQPTDLKRIFDPFEQDAQARFGTMGGLGLGLAISRNIVEMHSGSIEARSEGVGNGSIFAVKLYTIMHAEHVPSKQHKSAKRELQGKRILLVDDHLDTNLALKMLLERRGYEVTTAGTATRGLELAQTTEFDLLVSDIGLPDGNGHDLLRNIRKHSNLKAISLSGYGTETDFHLSHEAGFHKHLKKPITFPELEQAIVELLLLPS